MHEHNRLLGQLEVLSQYSGLELDHAFPQLVRGHLQHAWDVTAPCPVDVDPARGLVSYVWSEPARQRLGRGRRVAIGSPWLYLLDRSTTEPAVPIHRPAEEILEEARLRRLAELQGRELETVSAVAPEAAAAANGTAWFPVHGLRGARLADALAEVVVSEGGPATIVLSEPDARVQAIRDSYTRRGLRVTSLGDRLRRPGVTGANLLERLLTVLRSHTATASNVHGEVLLHAASAGVPVRVAGPSPERDDDTGRAEAQLELAELVGDDAALRELADVELGRAAVLPPRELVSLFDWTQP